MTNWSQIQTLRIKTVRITNLPIGIFFTWIRKPCRSQKSNGSKHKEANNTAQPTIHPPPVAAALIRQRQYASEKVLQKPRQKQIAPHQRSRTRDSRKTITLISNSTANWKALCWPNNIVGSQSGTQRADTMTPRNKPASQTKQKRTDFRTGLWLLCNWLLWNSKDTALPFFRRINYHKGNNTLEPQKRNQSWAKEECINNIPDL